MSGLVRADAPRRNHTGTDGTKPQCGGGSSYGVLSAVQKDNLYWFGHLGFLYSTPWVVTRETARLQAMLLLTASRRPFELRVGSSTHRLTAAAIAPLTPRGLISRDIAQISLHVGIRHPAFPSFRRIPAPGILSLDRDAFGRFDEALVEAYEGTLDHRAAERLFVGLVAATLEALPPTAPCDDRTAIGRRIVLENPNIRLSEVAERLGVSNATASKLVADAIGLPLRAYQHARKCESVAKRLMSDAPLTQLAHDAGFTDSAHLTHAWQRSFGHAPSYTRDRDHVRVVVRGK